MKLLGLVLVLMASTAASANEKTVCKGNALVERSKDYGADRMAEKVSWSFIYGDSEKMSVLFNDDQVYLGPLDDNSFSVILSKEQAGTSTEKYLEVNIQDIDAAEYGGSFVLIETKYSHVNNGKPTDLISTSSALLACEVVEN